MRWRRTGFRLLLIAAGLLAGEGAARLFCHFGPVHVSRARLGAERWTLANAAEAEEKVPLRAGPWKRIWAPHPFVGTVFNPEDRGTAAPRPDGSRSISEDGFFELDRADPKRFTIGVFGASVAALTALNSHAVLRKLPPAVTGNREVAIRVFAVSAHKQPQQLMALAYALVLGERFDVVVNLDGFNDLGFAGHLFEHQVFPLYPFGWSSLVAKEARQEELAARGEKLYAARRRQQLAAVFSRRPWSSSAVGALVWKRLDRRWEEPSESDATAAARSHSYAAQGPSRALDSAEAALATSIDAWRRSSLQMARLCAANDILYLHFLQPNQYDSGSKPMGREERGVAYDARSPLRQIVPAGYPRLSEGGEELKRQGVRFVDLRSIFARTPEPRYADACCHFNQQGNDAMAERIVSEIVAASGTGRGGALEP